MKISEIKELNKKVIKIEELDKEIKKYQEALKLAEDSIKQRDLDSHGYFNVSFLGGEIENYLRHHLINLKIEMKPFISFMRSYIKFLKNQRISLVKEIEKK